MTTQKVISPIHIVPNVESTLKTIVKKIGRLTMGFFRLVIAFLDEGALRHRQVIEAKDKWRSHNTHYIRGLY